MTKIVLIGSGNVATNLAFALKDKCAIAQIYSRKLAHARELAEQVGCEHYTDALGDVVADAQVYILAVNDDAIADIAASLPDNNALWIHTSGSKPLDLLKTHGKRAVMWPMQSLSKSSPKPLEGSYIGVEANTATALSQVKRRAKMLTANVVEADGEKRLQMHMASVFACNFSNHMYTLAAEILKGIDLDFEVLLPLVRNTVDKLSSLSPLESQTGPAARGDHEVIDTHRKMLDGDKKEIYELLSRSIEQRQRDKDK
ncbi:MAG: DUF2520 domain-containing protein [Muribaculaceae bacterium]|nr:DUF2520 domain-containing protein [Muribaculaceae bacterium]